MFVWSKFLNIVHFSFVDELQKKSWNKIYTLSQMRCLTVLRNYNVQLHICAFIQGGPKKVNPKCSTHNFVKYWPIFKILSLLQSLENLQCTVINCPTTPQTRRYTTL